METAFYRNFCRSLKTPLFLALSVPVAPVVTARGSRCTNVSQLATRDML